MTDYTNIMMRSVLVPVQAKNPAVAGQFIDFLLSKKGRALLADKAGLPPLDPGLNDNSNGLRPIRLGPGLLVYLDQLKRKRFLADWEGSMRQ